MTKLVLRRATYAEDQEGNRVFLQSGTQVSEITDAGPELVATIVVDDHISPVSTIGWNVTFKVHHPGLADIDEIVTMDAVALLQALQ